MRLADFIIDEMEQIVAEWEAFATTLLPAAATMESLALRDHAQQILEAVASDLKTTQTREAQAEKSKGRAPVPIGAPETAAQTHAVLRAKSGFDIKQLTAEYRALRASVLRLWIDACKDEPPRFEDVIRFNEAIDQALAESISFFTAQVEQSRNLMLGMVGHDMRSPLQIVILAATHLSSLNAGPDVSEAAFLLKGSGARMKALLDDLLEFNRSQLGVGIHITPADIALGDVFTDQVRLLRAAYPGRRVDLEVRGDTRGSFDGLRLQRVLENLVVNAIKYGDPAAAIRVILEGQPNEIRFEVHNSGTIRGSILTHIFEPLKRGSQDAATSDGSLGLGLYIVREIIKAHGGDIDARSGDGQTVFAVRLPRTS